MSRQTELSGHPYIKKLFLLPNASWSIGSDRDLFPQVSIPSLSAVPAFENDRPLTLFSSPLRRLVLVLPRLTVPPTTSRTPFRRCMHQISWLLL